jgi:hypothetical protein
VSRRRFTRSDLSPEQQAAVERQLADAGQGPETFPTLKAAIQKASVAVRGPYRSKAEADYADFLASHPYCVWRYERLVVRLPGKGTRYATDFTVRWTEVTTAQRASGAAWLPWSECYAVEVKGTKRQTGKPYWRSHAARRRALDGAAELWEALRIPLFVAWRVEGRWVHERVEVRDVR